MKYRPPFIAYVYEWGRIARRLLPEIIGAAIALVLIGVCGCSHSCPKPPPCIPPPPVVTVVKPPPCTLPELPEPIVGLGVPDAQRDGYFVPRQRWAELGGYQVRMRAWIEAAAACLQAASK